MGIEKGVGVLGGAAGFVGSGGLGAAAQGVSALVGGRTHFEIDGQHVALSADGIAKARRVWARGRAVR